MSFKRAVGELMKSTDHTDTHLHGCQSWLRVAKKNHLSVPQSGTVYERHANAYQWQKTSQFKASCEDSKKPQESWTYKTAKIISRTRVVRPRSVDVLTNTNKVHRDTFYFVSYCVSDYRNFNLSYLMVSDFLFLNVFTMTIE
jgi:hypothetical protein